MLRQSAVVISLLCRHKAVASNTERRTRRVEWRNDGALSVIRRQRRAAHPSSTSSRADGPRSASSGGQAVRSDAEGRIRLRARVFERVVEAFRDDVKMAVLPSAPSAVISYL
jgi:hypothetical protein